MTRHLAFFHQNYPAQFGPIIQFLLEHYDTEISFYSEYVAKPLHPKVKHVSFKPDGTGSEEKDTSYFFSRYFEREARSMYGAYKAFEAHRENLPDCFIGHVGFGNLMMFHVAYPDIPTIGFFEVFYDFKEISRPEYPVPWENRLRVPLRNATQLLELEYCTKGYSPTPYQRSMFPDAYQHKLEVLFDGVDTDFYSPGQVIGNALPKTWPDGVKLVTFVSRGLESYRGFDVFMEVAHRICQRRSDVHFIIAGNPKTHYGAEMLTVKEPSFKEHVLKRHQFDLNRFHFLDWVSESALVDLFRLSDCHFYWTIPFTLSWSFFQAMAAGALICGSDTAPVQDVLVHQENGLICDPNSIDAMVEQIMEALAEPERYRPLREAARETVIANYSLPVCLPKLADFYLDKSLVPSKVHVYESC